MEHTMREYKGKQGYAFLLKIKEKKKQTTRSERHQCSEATQYLSIYVMDTPLKKTRCFTPSRSQMPILIPKY